LSPEITLIAGAETVLWVERNMSKAVKRGAANLPGSESTSRAKGSRWNLGGPASDRQFLTLAVRIGKARSRSR